MFTSASREAFYGGTLLALTLRRGNRTLSVFQERSEFAMSRLPSLVEQIVVPSGETQPAAWLGIVRMVEELSTMTRFEDIQEHVAHTARSLVGADGVTFVLREGGLCHYVKEEAIGPLWKGQRFPMSACISGWSMLNASTAVVPDVYADPRIPIHAYEPTFVRSLIMVPIGLKDPLGAIGAYWSHKRSFDEETVTLLEGLARSTASAVSMVHFQSMLTLAEERALRAQEIGGLGAWTIDAENGGFSASLIFKAHFGRARACDLTYAEVLSQIHPEDREALRHCITNAVEHGDPFRLACRVTWPDGSRHWLDLQADIVHDSRGAVARVCGISVEFEPSVLSQ